MSSWSKWTYNTIVGGGMCVLQNNEFQSVGAEKA
jgi:hypothetical protein